MTHQTYVARVTVTSVYIQTVRAPTEEEAVDLIENAVLDKGHTLQSIEFLETTPFTDDITPNND